MSRDMGLKGGGAILVLCHVTQSLKGGGGSDSEKVVSYFGAVGAEENFWRFQKGGQIFCYPGNSAKGVRNPGNKGG